jgi:hypothetical protein
LPLPLALPWPTLSPANKDGFNGKEVLCQATSTLARTQNNDPSPGRSRAVWRLRQRP